MTMEAWWALGVGGVVVAAVVGFLIGRTTSGPKRKMAELESALERAKEETGRYRKEVDEHFDKTATLFVSMAGSYKELFEHLSSGYEKLSDGSARDLFRDRVSGLLVGTADVQPMIGRDPAAVGLDATPAAEAPEGAPVTAERGDEDMGDQASPAMPDGEPVVNVIPLEEPVLPEAERRQRGREPHSEKMAAA